jgi:CO/xanthine dehydrogenase Mo-binding subunit
VILAPSFGIGLLLREAGSGTRDPPTLAASPCASCRSNADIPNLDVLFVGGFDEEASPLGAEGLGELTAVSVAPAIANAVYHATGKRIRDLPITAEKLL